MRAAFLLLSLGMLLMPFVVLKRPWAVKLWAKARLLFVIYAVAVLVSALVALATRWDAIYG
jgi:hypothetical protein